DEAGASQPFEGFDDLLRLVAGLQEPALELPSAAVPEGQQVQGAVVRRPAGSLPIGCAGHVAGIGDALTGRRARPAEGVPVPVIPPGYHQAPSPGQPDGTPVV